MSLISDAYRKSGRGSIHRSPESEIESPSNEPNETRRRPGPKKSSPRRAGRDRSSGGPGAARNPAPASADPREYVYLALKHRWLIASILVLVPAVAAVYSLQKMPHYAASALLQISRERVNVIQDIVENPGRANEFYGTHVRLIQSNAMAQRAIARLELWKHPYFQKASAGEPPPADPDHYLGLVLSSVSARYLEGTELIRISFRTADPGLSALLANTLAREYIEFTTERESGVVRNTASFLTEQIEKLQKDIEHKEALIEQYRTSESRRALTMQGLEDLNTELTRAGAERDSAQIRYESLREADPGSLSEVLGDPQVQYLSQYHEELRAQHEKLSTRFKPDWPEVKRVTRAMEEARRRLEQAMQAAAEMMISDAYQNLQAAEKKEAALRQAVERRRRDVQEADAALAEYHRAKVEIDNQKLHLQELLRRQSEAGLSAEFGEHGPVYARLAEEATPPFLPEGPGLWQNLLMSLLAAMVLAFGAVLGLEYWSTMIVTVEDARRRIPSPYWGMIPRYAPRDPIDPDSTQKVAIRFSDRHPASFLLAHRSESSLEAAEERAVLASFKFLRAVLLSSLPPSSRTILITSPHQGSGKTFLSCNLAAALAQMGKTTLLIDADLRIPQMRKIFGVRSERGLAELLSEPSDGYEDFVVPTRIPHLFLLGAGARCPSPAELLGSEAMEQLLTVCSTRYDYVVLDSTPLLAVPDALAVARWCDETVLVVRSRVTRLRSVEATLDLCERSGCRISGVVLNDIDLADVAESYYHSYHGYEYQAYSHGDRARG